MRLRGTLRTPHHSCSGLYASFLDLLQEASTSGTPNYTFYAHVGHSVYEIIDTQKQKGLPRATLLACFTVSVDMTGKFAAM